MRSDPNFINTVKNLKHKNGSLAIWLIPSYMKDYFEINECDGLENISLLRDEFKSDMISRINNNDSIRPEEKKK